MARGLWGVGALMVLAGLAMIVGGITCTAVTANDDVATVAELDVYDARSTKGVLLISGGVFTSAAGGQVCRAARHRGRSSRLGRALLVGGYLLVGTGLAVFAEYGASSGFYVGLGLQAVGAVAVGVGGSMARPNPGPPSRHDPPSPHGSSGQ